MNARLICACACLALLPVSAAAAPSGPSLQATLGAIRDRMLAQGHVEYMANLRDTADGSAWSNSFTADATGISVNAEKCEIAFHWKTTLQGKTVQDIDTALLFGRFSKVAVVNREQEIRQQVAGDHPSWVAIVSPAVWVVTFSGPNDTRVLDFTSQDAAERVARAADHAMDLCNAPKAGF
jgi:hypothetical protein